MRRSCCVAGRSHDCGAWQSYTTGRATRARLADRTIGRPAFGSDCGTLSRFCQRPRLSGGLECQHVAHAVHRPAVRHIGRGGRQRGGRRKRRPGAGLLVCGRMLQRRTRSAPATRDAQVQLCRARKTGGLCRPPAWRGCGVRRRTGRGAGCTPSARAPAGQGAPAGRWRPHTGTRSCAWAAPGWWICRRPGQLRGVPAVARSGRRTAATVAARTDARGGIGKGSARWRRRCWGGSACWWSGRRPRQAAARCG